MMKKIFSSVDIGSNSIKIVVTELFNDELYVLASVNYPSIGIKNGVVVKEEEFTMSLKKAFEEVNGFDEKEEGILDCCIYNIGVGN